MDGNGDVWQWSWMVTGQMVTGRQNGDGTRGDGAKWWHISGRVMNLVMDTAHQVDSNWTYSTDMLCMYCTIYFTCNVSFVTTVDRL